MEYCGHAGGFDQSAPTLGDSWAVPVPCLVSMGLCKCALWIAANVLWWTEEARAEECRAVHSSSRPVHDCVRIWVCVYVCVCVCVFAELSSCVYVCVRRYIIPWATRVPCVPRVDWFTNSGCSCVPWCCLSDAEHYDPCCVVSAFFDLDSRYCRAVDVGMFHCLVVVTVAVFWWSWLIRRVASLWLRNRRLSIIHATATAVVNQCVVCALDVAVDW